MSGPTTPTWRSAPRRLWAHYWQYVVLSALLFGAGAVAGGVFVDAVDLSLLFGTQSSQEAFPEPTVGVLVANNLVVLALLLASGLTLGLGTAAILVYNGFIVGYVVVLVARAEGAVVPVVGILPHGVLEVPAILFASAVAFRFSHQVLGAATGRRTDVMTRTEFREAVLLAALAFALIPVAAYVEATVTTELVAGYR